MDEQEERPRARLLHLRSRGDGMWGAMQGAEVRKDLLEADARDRKSQCRSSGEKIAGDMAIFT